MTRRKKILAPGKNNLDPLLAPLPIQHTKNREPENRTFVG